MCSHCQKQSRALFLAALCHFGRIRERAHGHGQHCRAQWTLRQTTDAWPRLCWSGTPLRLIEALKIYLMIFFIQYEDDVRCSWTRPRERGHCIIKQCMFNPAAHVFRAPLVPSWNHFSFVCWASLMINKVLRWFVAIAQCGNRHNTTHKRITPTWGMGLGHDENLCSHFV